MANDTRNPIDSIEIAITTDPRDWSIDPVDAWIYGIIVGWGDALPEVTARHGWDAAARARLDQLQREALLLSIDSDARSSETPVSSERPIV